MRDDFCSWCWKPIQVPPEMDKPENTLVCSDVCGKAEWAFRCYFSDAAIAARMKKQNTKN